MLLTRPQLAAAWPRRRVHPQAEPRQSAPLSEPRLGLGLGLRLGLGLLRVRVRVRVRVRARVRDRDRVRVRLG